jgi:hypothetical protein
VKRRESAAFAVRLLAAACLIWGPLASIARAETGTSGAVAVVSEEKVKAAFVMRFLNYVEWPANSFAQADSPFVIGISGAPEVARELEKSAAVQVPGKRSIVIRRLGDHDPLRGVHALLVGNGEHAGLGRWLAAVGQQPILLITEVDGAPPRGSMINFRVADDRVRFDIVLEPVENAGLKLNSRLLAVAMNVIKGPGP